MMVQAIPTWWRLLKLSDGCGGKAPQGIHNTENGSRDYCDCPVDLPRIFLPVLTAMLVAPSAFTGFPSALVVAVPPGVVTVTAKRSRLRWAGPSPAFFHPLNVKCEPWHGHSN